MIHAAVLVVEYFYYARHFECVRVYEGDRKAEAEVDSRLLIPFRQCLRWNCDDQSSSTDKHRSNQYDVVVTYVNQVYYIGLYGILY